MDVVSIYYAFFIKIRTKESKPTTHFMVFSATHTICEGPKLDAQRSQSVMFANYQYEIICQQK